MTIIISISAVLSKVYVEIRSIPLPEVDLVGTASLKVP